MSFIVDAITIPSIMGFLLLVSSGILVVISLNIRSKTHTMLDKNQYMVSQELELLREVRNSLLTEIIDLKSRIRILSDKLAEAESKRTVSS